MKLNDLVKTFEIYKTNEEQQMLEKLDYPKLLSSFNEHEQFIIEGMIRKSLVIKIGDTDPKVIANEF